MENYYIVSFSGGKDSTALLLHLLELGERVDEVIYCDVYKEFPAMYKHVEKIKKVVEDAGIKFTTLQAEKDYNYYMFDKPKDENRSGLAWATFKVRWCSFYLKVDLIKKYLKELKKQYNVIQYIGLASDEEKRLQRKNASEKGKEYPLVKWGWTEQDCLNYCYSLGYDWDNLYKYFKRVSCWCCPLQSLDDLRNLKRHFPELWQELKEMDQRSWNQFRADYSVEELEKRFNFEDEKIAKGESIRNRAFYTELKEILQK